MGRSVSNPRGTVVAAYRTLDYDDYSCGEEWQDLKEWFGDAAKQAWPSLYDHKELLGREDVAILQNEHCYMGLSEYCGLVCLWVTAKGAHNGNDTTTGLQLKWCQSIAPRFLALFAEYRRVGTFSNGTGIYERTDGQDRTPQCDKLGGMLGKTIEA